MYNWDSPWEECVLVGRKSIPDSWATFVFLLSLGFLALEWSLAPVSRMPLWLGWTVSLVVERWTSITMSQRSKASNPSIRSSSSKELMSDSVELWETDVCFLPIQLHGKYVPLPQIHKTLPEVDFESSRSPAKSESWNKASSTKLCRVSHITVLPVFLCDECMRSNVLIVCHMLLSISSPHEQVSSQTIKYQAFQYVLSINISEQLVSKQWTIIGLLPLMIILITASLSSKMCNCASHWAELVFVTTWSRSDNWSTSRLPFFFHLVVEYRKQFPGPWVDDFILFEECITFITTPASNDRISDSVELSDTDVCFLHIQLMGTNVRLPKIHEIPPRLMQRSPAKSESWNQPNRQCWAMLPAWQHCR